MKKFLSMILVVVLLLFSTGCSFNRMRRVLLKIGYSQADVTAIEERLTKEQIGAISKKEYLDYLLPLITQENYQPERFTEYLAYIEAIPSEYDMTDVVTIVNNEISYPYSEKLASLLHEKYYIASRLERYMAYEGASVTETVTNVNANRDFAYYSHTQGTDISRDYCMLVNKYYYLSKDYTPADLVKVSLSYAYSDNACRKVVLDAFIKMYQAAKKDHIQLIINSSYRSYESQEALWTGRKTNSGTEAADAYAARAGYSEHQTGLALDLDQYGANGNSQAYDWLAKNAYQYGFILRYPKGKEDITGYQYEAWHYRYVGTDVAKYIFENDITLEEYYAYFIQKS